MNSEIYIIVLLVVICLAGLAHLRDAHVHHRDPLIEEVAAIRLDGMDREAVLEPYGGDTESILSELGPGRIETSRGLYRLRLILRTENPWICEVVGREPTMAERLTVGDHIKALYKRKHTREENQVRITPILKEMVWVPLREEVLAAREANSLAMSRRREDNVRARRRKGVHWWQAVVSWLNHDEVGMRYLADDGGANEPWLGRVITGRGQNHDMWSGYEAQP